MWKHRFQQLSITDRKLNLIKVRLIFIFIWFHRKLPPIKNVPSSCVGAGSAYVPIAMIEFQSNKNGSNKIYSEQFLLDCVKTNGG